MYPRDIILERLVRTKSSGSEDIKKLEGYRINKPYQTNQYHLTNPTRNSISWWSLSVWLSKLEKVADPSYTHKQIWYT